MSEMSDDPEDYPPDLDETPDTRPMDPSQRGTRRPIPADDLPRAYGRPALSRRPYDEPPPRSSRTLPPAPPPVYNPPPRQARTRRGKQSRPPAPPREKRDSGLYLPWWSLVIMLVFVGCAAVGALLVVNSIGGGVAPGGETPVVIVITSTFTAGPPASPTPIPQPSTLTPTAPLPTIPPTASLPPGNFAVGSTVKVIGVGLSGLNVRTAPGIDSAVKFRASDDELFVLKDGPQTASNEEWWYIQDPKDQNRGGWASRRFLTVITS
jgi:hypothetical protein